MGWGRDERVRGSLSPGGSPVAQHRRRMSTVKIVNNDPPEWLNIRNNNCPLLQPVLGAKRTPSKIIIPELTVTGNPFSHPIEQIQAETSQRATPQNSAPTSTGGTALTLGGHAVEAPLQATAVPLTSDSNLDNLLVAYSDLSEGLEQTQLSSDRLSTPSAQPSTSTPTLPWQNLIPPAQSAPMPPSQAQVAMEQQTEPQNMILPAQLAPQPAMSSFQASLAANEQHREPQSKGLPAQSAPKKPYAIVPSASGSEESAKRARPEPPRCESDNLKR